MKRLFRAEIRRVRTLVASMIWAPMRAVAFSPESAISRPAPCVSEAAMDSRMRSTLSSEESPVPVARADADSASSDLEKQLSIPGASTRFSRKESESCW